jgi:hypothetical protein
MMVEVMVYINFTWHFSSSVYQFVVRLALMELRSRTIFNSGRTSRHRHLVGKVSKPRTVFITMFLLTGPRAIVWRISLWSVHVCYTTTSMESFLSLLLFDLTFVVVDRAISSLSIDDKQVHSVNVLLEHTILNESADEKRVLHQWFFIDQIRFKYAFLHALCLSTSNGSIHWH